jgi:hypothetical protein
VCVLLDLMISHRIDGLTGAPQLMTYDDDPRVQPGRIMCCTICASPDHVWLTTGPSPNLLG